MASAPSGNVLVLGDGDLAALAIVRSLGRMNLQVHLASFEGSPITRHSRFVARRHALGHPLVDEPGFVQGLLGLIGTTPFDLVIPTSDKALVPLMSHRDEIARLSRFVAPTPKGFRVTNRKDETVALAAACGLRVPRTIRVDTGPEAEAFELSHPYPAVLKPVVSHVPGRAERYRVRLGTLGRRIGAAATGDGRRVSRAGAGVLRGNRTRTERTGARRDDLGRVSARAGARAPRGRSRLLSAQRAAVSGSARTRRAILPGAAMGRPGDVRVQAAPPPRRTRADGSQRPFLGLVGSRHSSGRRFPPSPLRIDGPRPDDSCLRLSRSVVRPAHRP